MRRVVTRSRVERAHPFHAAPVRRDDGGIPGDEWWIESEAGTRLKNRLQYPGIMVVTVVERRTQLRRCPDREVVPMNERLPLQ
jgi:hypothetical protein